jgi:hypothetical protein
LRARIPHEARRAQWQDGGSTVLTMLVLTMLVLAMLVLAPKS